MKRSRMSRSVKKVDKKRLKPDVGFRRKLKLFIEHHPNAFMIAGGTGALALGGAIPATAMPVATIEQGLLTGSSMGLIGGGMLGQFAGVTNHINSWFDKKFGKKKETKK